MREALSVIIPLILVPVVSYRMTIASRANGPSWAVLGSCLVCLAPVVAALTILHIPVTWSLVGMIVGGVMVLSVMFVVGMLVAFVRMEWAKMKQGGHG